MRTATIPANVAVYSKLNHLTQLASIMFILCSPRPSVVYSGLPVEYSQGGDCGSGAEITPNKSEAVAPRNRYRFRLEPPTTGVLAGVGSFGKF